MIKFVNKHLLGHFYALLVTILVSLSFISSASLAKVVNPISLTLLRFLIASIVLLPVVFLQKNYWQQLKLVAWRGSIIGLLYALYFISFFESLKTTTTLHTGTLYTLVPLLTAVLSTFIFQQKLSFKNFIIYIIGAFGTIWVIFDGNLIEIEFFSLDVGDYIFMIAVITTCAYSLLLKALYKSEFNVVVLIFTVLLSGTIWMFVTLLLLGKPLDWSRIHGINIFHISYLAVGATVLSFLYFQKSIILLDPNKATAYIYLTPAFVVIFAFLFRLEYFPGFKVQVGIVISVIATLLLEFSASDLRNSKKS
ncbi:DMT family transporter [Lentisphaerota bacterium WC36G]|nr:DMT family transporter [Lentisphaerae bacterium WC36]